MNTNTLLYGIIGLLLLAIAGTSGYALVSLYESKGSDGTDAVATMEQLPTTPTSESQTAEAPSPAPASNSSDDDDDEGDDDTPASPTPAPTAAPAPSAAGITIDTVIAHNTAASCYTVVEGNVYDLTSFVSKHPGGSGAIKSLCGVDGTAAFNDQHGGDEKPERVLAGFMIGPLVP